MDNLALVGLAGDILGITPRLADFLGTACERRTLDMKKTGSQIICPELSVHPKPPAGFKGAPPGGKHAGVFVLAWR